MKESINQVRDILSLGEIEKMQQQLWRSPKKGKTFVKVYNPFSSNGIFLHENKRTKYVCFNVRFYSAPKLPKNFDAYKEHILELPLYTAFPVYKQLIKRNEILDDEMPIYLVITGISRYEFSMRMLEKDNFFKELKKHDPYYKEESEKEDIL